MFQWVMDALVCNGLGIYLGMRTLNYLSMKPYHWQGMWNIQSYRLVSSQGTSSSCILE